MCEVIISMYIHSYSALWELQGITPNKRLICVQYWLLLFKVTNSLFPIRKKIRWWWMKQHILVAIGNLKHNYCKNKFWTKISNENNAMEFSTWSDSLDLEGALFGVLLSFPIFLLSPSSSFAGNSLVCNPKIRYLTF